MIAARVRTFKGMNYLSLGQQSQIEIIEDIGDTANIEEDDLQDRGIVKKSIEGEIDAVIYTDEYEACMTCKSKVMIEDDIIAACSKCGIVMKRSRCMSLPKFLSLTKTTRHTI